MENSVIQWKLNLGTFVVVAAAETSSFVCLK